MNNKMKSMPSRISNIKPAGIIVVILILITSSYACKNDVKPTQQVQSGPSFDSLKAVHDSLLARYTAANSQVDALITRTAASDSELHKRDREINRLKGELKHYHGVSAKLKKDESFIASIKNELSEKERSFAEQLGLLKSDKDALTQKLSDLLAKYSSMKELGSVLDASNIRIEAIHEKHNGRKEKRTTKARKLNVLRVIFDIDENRIAESGTKKLYLVISGPDGRMLSNGDKSMPSLTLSNGQVINYSIVKEVPLQQNEPVKDVTVDWKQHGEREKGAYNIAIYNGGYKIGAGSVALK